MSSEIIFEVREAEEGGYTARALGQSIFTEADDLDQLRRNVQAATACHFDANDPDRPLLIRLHIVRDEVLTA